jgi:hypothetical protein
LNRLVSPALRRHHAQLLFFAAIIIGRAWFGVITLDDVRRGAFATKIGLAGGLVECGDLDSGESRIDIMFGYCYSNPNSNRR